MNEAQQEEI